MKKTLIILLTLCGIMLASNIQAKNIDFNNGSSQNENSANLTTLNDASNPSGSNTTIPFPATDLMILAIIGFFFAKKHQSLAKKHRDLTQKKQSDTNTDSILNH